MERVKRPLNSLEVDILETLEYEGAMGIPHLTTVIRERNAAIRPDNGDVYHAIENLIAFGKVGLVERHTDMFGASIETFVWVAIRKHPIGWMPPIKPKKSPLAQFMSNEAVGDVI